jgi:hypothetical protein
MTGRTQIENHDARSVVFFLVDGTRFLGGQVLGQ